MDVTARATSAAGADGEGVWSWHPWAGVKSASDDLRATVTNKVMDTGESTQKVVSHCAGKAGSSGANL
jgi:hypothetical protein